MKVPPKLRFGPMVPELVGAYAILITGLCLDYFSEHLPTFIDNSNLDWASFHLPLGVWVILLIELGFVWWSDELRATHRRALIVATILVLLYPAVMVGLRAGAIFFDEVHPAESEAKMLSRNPN